VPICWRDFEAALRESDDTERPGSDATAPTRAWLDERAVTPIRVALALLYFYLGILKFFPDLSPAEMLATQTILRFRLGFTAHTALVVLAVFEVSIALMLILRVPMKVVFPVFVVHMMGAMSPLVLLPELTFKFAPFAPTFEGQYIVKNIVLLAAGWTLYRYEANARSESS
jgi:uncharacterized membrane protein YkgB